MVSCPLTAYFERLDSSRFRATEHVGGAWKLDEQHIAPALGLLAHLVEADRNARRSDGLVIGRLSYDILGPVPVSVVETEVRVARPGRTVELVEARLIHHDRVAVVLRAWLMRPYDTDRLAATGFASLVPPEVMPAWSAVWPAPPACSTSPTG